MVHKLFISSKIADARADVFLQTIQNSGTRAVRSVQILDVYSIKKHVTKAQIDTCGQMLANPVYQHYFIDTVGSHLDFHWAIEVGFLPGVTDNVAATAMEMISDNLHTTFGIKDHVYTSKIYLLKGRCSQKAVEKIAQSLYNPIIQRVVIADTCSFPSLIENLNNIPEVKLRFKQIVDTIHLDVDDEELRRIGSSGIANKDGTRRGPLALSLPYMKVIQKYFSRIGRNPTDIEVESIAQTWSEHCRHTLFADPIDEFKDGLFKTYIRNATIKIRKSLGKKDFCASVFTDNSGAIRFDDTYLITHKVETHNSPSALDPFGGSITGICGVNRDAIGFGLGAKPIANTYGFCLSDPRDVHVLYRGKNATQPMLAPRRIFDGIVAGVNAGGNCSGIPTPLGSICFDQSYKGKPLVFVGTVGLIPKKSHGVSMVHKRACPGDYIVMIGGRVGLDGIHGATFSSEGLTSGSPATAVQIGDPITQKKLSDALVKEARDRGLYTSITDNGAGGLSCSVAEMAKESGGCKVQLDTVPLKYPGLSPWQIWISESQERMTVSVPPKKWKPLRTLLQKRSVEATVIGVFTDSGSCIVRFGSKTIMDLPMRFLHEGRPHQHLMTTYRHPTLAQPDVPKGGDMTDAVRAILMRRNIAGYAFITNQYDHEVQGTSVLKPLVGPGLVNGDSSVIRPVLGEKKGVVLGQSMYPWYGDVDMYHMAACTIDSAIRSVVAAGANPKTIALLDNFCWCDSKNPERLGQLKEALRGCYDTAVFYKTPFISGKDSMFNDFSGFDEKGNDVHISIKPTLLISAIGIMDDIKKVVSLDFKKPGDLIYVIGETHEELGASEYFGYLGEKTGIYHEGMNVPVAHLKQNQKIYTVFSTCVQHQFVASAISVGRGGLAVAVCKSAIAGLLGIDISVAALPGDAHTDTAFLFSESQGRILLSINPHMKVAFEKKLVGIPFRCIGTVCDRKDVHVKGINGKTIISTDVGTLKTAYDSTFKKY
jgi:phosphoribosylformylglycinamidine synthase